MAISRWQQGPTIVKAAMESTRIKKFDPFDVRKVFSMLIWLDHLDLQFLFCLFKLLTNISE